jgi:hypothetical protein
MVKLYQDLFGIKHPDTLSAMLNLAATYRATSKLGDAATIE